MSEFRILLDRMIKQLGVSETALNEGYLDHLSGLAYQLFLNADEHGSFDLTGERYSSGLRGILVRLRVLPDIKTLVEYAGDDTSFSAYLTKLVGTGKSKLNGDATRFSSKQIHLLEISVFDTGPGIALRWLSDSNRVRSYSDISPSEELDAVRACFHKHATTKASQFTGLGLSMALIAMKRLNAFMTLRTGRLSLHQDFSRSNTYEFKPQKRFKDPAAVPEISGTAYSICFRVK
jgi:hypothetical protein